jgi:hypothetical protein
MMLIIVLIHHIKSKYTAIWEALIFLGINEMDKKQRRNPSERWDLVRDNGVVQDMWDM